MLVFDAKEALVRADMQIARLAVADYKSCILVANKCDLLSDRELSNVEEQATHPPVPRPPSLAPRPSHPAPIEAHHATPLLWATIVVTDSAHLPGRCANGCRCYGMRRSCARALSRGRASTMRSTWPSRPRAGGESG